MLTKWPTGDPELRLVGTRIFLRPVVPADATAAYVRWLNDPETNRYLETVGPNETIESVRRYIDQRINDPSVLFLAIVERAGNRHVGNVKLEPIDWTRRRATLGIMIGQPAARGKGYGVESIGLVLRHAFSTMRLRRVELGVAAENTIAVRAYEKAGLQVEERRQVTHRGRDTTDVLQMAVEADDVGGIVFER